MAKNIHPQAYVDPAARIGEGVTIMPFAYIEIIFSSMTEISFCRFLMTWGWKED